MPKIKTHKATAKRFTVKRSKKGLKILKRQDGQDHFNSRESGKVKRNKRRDNSISTALQKTVKKALPYS
ncbi:MAG: 50S ribosomal protein L35 [Patescibacteria group bacterium]